jgi:hypothetical protein
MSHAPIDVCSQIVDLWSLVRVCRPVATTRPQIDALDRRVVALAPTPYDRARRRSCTLNNQGSRRRRFSTWPPRRRFYAAHRSERFAARMNRLVA